MTDKLQRAFDLGGFHLRDDGRTIEGRILPFNEPATVIDPGGPPYEEMFAPGCLDWVCAQSEKRGNAGFIGLDLDHRDDLDHRIGSARSVEQRDDGAYAVFRLYNGPDLPKVQSMLEDSHTGLSVNFADRRRARTVEGVVQRVDIHVFAVACTPVPAYTGAKIMAMRSIDDIVPVETPHFEAVREWLRELNPDHATPWDDIDTSIFHAGDCCG
jgi:HK97 family phage prohead protease